MPQSPQQPSRSTLSQGGKQSGAPQSARQPGKSQTGGSAALVEQVKQMTYKDGAKAVSPQGPKVGAPGAALTSDPILAAVAAGKQSVAGGRGAHIKALQEALIAAGYPLPKFGADGAWGFETSAAVKAFQAAHDLVPDGVVGKLTLGALSGNAPASTPGGTSSPAAPKVDPKPSGTSTQAPGQSTPKTNPKQQGPQQGGAKKALANAFFADNPTLAKVLRGETTISGGNGAHIKLVQQALMNLGYNLPVHGADGGWGGESRTALIQFQKDHAGKSDGVLDAATMSALDDLAPADGTPLVKYPQYEELFKDGLLDATIAVGYDEDGNFDYEIDKIRERISSELGCEAVGAGKAQAAYKGAGMTMSTQGGEYFMNPNAFQYKGKKVAVLIRLVTYKDEEARASFLEGLQKSDVSVYTGHGRYGSGPDFDDKHSNKGNVWVNPNQGIYEEGANKTYAELKAGKTERPLEKIQFDRKYKVWFFDGCNTRLYMNAIRANATLDHKSVDVFGAGTEISTSTTADDVIGFVGGIVQRQSAQQILQNLNNMNGITEKNKGFQAEGLGDNKTSA